MSAYRNLIPKYLHISIIRSTLKRQIILPEAFFLIRVAPSEEAGNYFPVRVGSVVSVSP